MEGPSLRRIVEEEGDEEAEDCCIASIAAANANIHRAIARSVRRDVVKKN
jgi:hypothetical protein